MEYFPVFAVPTLHAAFSVQVRPFAVAAPRGVEFVAEELAEEVVVPFRTVHLDTGQRSRQLSVFIDCYVLKRTCLVVGPVAVVLFVVCHDGDVLSVHFLHVFVVADNGGHWGVGNQFTVVAAERFHDVRVAAVDVDGLVFPVGQVQVFDDIECAGRYQLSVDVEDSVECMFFQCFLPVVLVQQIFAFLSFDDVPHAGDVVIAVPDRVCNGVDVSVHAHGIVYLVVQDVSVVDGSILHVYLQNAEVRCQIGIDTVHRYVLDVLAVGHTFVVVLRHVGHVALFVQQVYVVVAIDDDQSFGIVAPGNEVNVGVVQHVCLVNGFHAVVFRVVGIEVFRCQHEYFVLSGFNVGDVPIGKIGGPLSHLSSLCRYE